MVLGLLLLLFKRKKLNYLVQDGLCSRLGCTYQRSLILHHQSLRKGGILTGILASRMTRNLHTSHEIFVWIISHSWCNEAKFQPLLLIYSEHKIWNHAVSGEIISQISGWHKVENFIPPWSGLNCPTFRRGCPRVLKFEWGLNPHTKNYWGEQNLGDPLGAIS